MKQSKFLQWHHMPRDEIPSNSCLYDFCLMKQFGNANAGAVPSQHDDNMFYYFWRYSHHSRVVTLIPAPSNGHASMLQGQSPPWDSGAVLTPGQFRELQRSWSQVTNRRFICFFRNWWPHFLTICKGRAHLLHNQLQGDFYVKQI